MKNEAWPTFSFTELLSPPEGWRTDCAILSTYSADLVVIVTALLALTGCDLDSRRTGSRVELVRAIEALRGKVCVLAQTGRVAIPNTFRPILKLLDKFVKTVDIDETFSSWHPKVSLVRYNNLEDATDLQWRVWVGSRNLTRALNWEAGLVLASRSDGKGQHIDGLAAIGEALAVRANLAPLPAKNIGKELADLTWECPPGSEIQRVSLLGPGLAKGFPQAPPDTDRMFVVSPFLDATTVRAASNWGSTKTHRVIVSTSMELQRLLHEDDKVFAGFDDLRVQPLPDLPAEGASTLDEETHTVVEIAEDEEAPPAGLHAKLLFAAKGSRRQLWLGSANATERGWEGRNVEVVSELSIARDTADAIEGFVATCERFNANTIPPKTDEDEIALERARKLLSGRWPLRQRINEDELQIEASTPPPLSDSTIEIQVAVLGGAWNAWPTNADRILLPGMRRWQRSDFVQVRVVRGERMCAWLQIAPCEPAPDEERDHALIAQYLDPRTFLWWLRSLLSDDPAHAAGGDWDAEPHTAATASVNDSRSTDIGFMPTVEEILRSWARDSSAFVSADEKVKSYLKELERRADESGAVADVDLLRAFRQTWETLALELR
jgi:hypothetical protein